MIMRNRARVGTVLGLLVGLKVIFTDVYLRWFGQQDLRKNSYGITDRVLIREGDGQEDAAHVIEM
jgi:hypothetical protein